MKNNQFIYFIFFFREKVTSLAGIFTVKKKPYSKMFSRNKFYLSTDFEKFCGIFGIQNGDMVIYRFLVRGLSDK